jgi:hypothetical protein
LSTFKEKVPELNLAVCIGRQKAMVVSLNKEFELSGFWFVSRRARQTHGPLLTMINGTSYSGQTRTFSHRQDDRQATSSDSYWGGAGL